MFESLALSEPTLVGGFVVLLVFGMLRYNDAIVEMIVSLDDDPAADMPEDYDPPGS